MVAKLRNNAKTTERPTNGPRGRGTPPRLTEADPAIAPRQAATAGYIAAMSGELAAMAHGVNLSLVAHFLAMAQAEAQDAADRAA